MLAQKLKVGSAIAPKLVKLTGKHPDEIHPKHLIKLENKDWYKDLINNKDSVLDIGCGNGQRTLKIAKLTGKIIGIDINQEDIDKAKREAKRLGIKNAEFKQADANKALKFPDSVFSVVFFCDVIEHLTGDALVLGEINRVLTKKGTLLLVGPNVDTSWKRLQKSVGLFYFSDPDHKREYLKKEIKTKLSNAGLKIVSISPVVYDTPLSGLIDLVGGFSLRAYKRLSLWKLNYAKKHPGESGGFRIVAIKS